MHKKAWFDKKPDSILDWIGIIFAGIAFYLLLGHINIFLDGSRMVLGILSPFAGGIVLAYILDPLVRTFTHHVLHDNRKLRWIGILFAYIVAILIVFLLAWLVIPQVISSVTTLYANIPGYFENLEGTLKFLQSEYDIQLTHAMQALDSYESLLTKASDMITSWAPQIMNYIGNVASNAVAVFTAIASSIYMLADKERLLHQLRTLVHAFLPPNVAANTLRICAFANQNFSGFFIGKIIDSAIIWIITFVSMNLLGMSFSPLISVVVGITNIIPVFGPFIGAIPSIVILLFVDPIQALEFLVLILIIQQLDGNFIGPKILGQSIGISALWVLFSIVLGGDLFGLVGMVLGVPVFATCYGLLQELVHFLLNLRSIDSEGNSLPSKEDSPQQQQQ